jgi:hypothetical protein
MKNNYLIIRELDYSLEWNQILASAKHYAQEQSVKLIVIPNSVKSPLALAAISNDLNPQFETLDLSEGVKVKNKTTEITVKLMKFNHADIGLVIECEEESIQWRFIPFLADGSLFDLGFCYTPNGSKSLDHKSGPIVI